MRSISSRTMAVILFIDREEKEIGINSRGELADIACTEEKFVAGDFCVRRGFAQSGDKQF